MKTALRNLNLCFLFRTLTLLGISSLIVPHRSAAQVVDVSYASTGSYTPMSTAKRVQIIYPKDELIAKGAPAAGGNISQLGLSVLSSSGALSGMSIRMRNIRPGALSGYNSTNGAASGVVPVVDYSISGTTLIVSAVNPSSFKIDVGQTLLGLSQVFVNPCCPYNYIIANGTGTGGAGTYTLAYSQSGSGSSNIFHNISPNVPVGFHHSVLTPVKSAFTYTPVDVADGAYDLITLDQPFAWDGVSDVLVDICFSSGTGPVLRSLGGVSSSKNSTGCATDVTGATSGNHARPRMRFVFGSVSCTAPNVPASAISFSSVTASGASISWTPGNGSGRVVYLNTVNSFVAPADGSTPSASTFYTGGQQCIYNGSGSGPVLVSGLQGNTTYHVRIYEYCLPGNTYASGPAAGNPASFATACAQPDIPTPAASQTTVCQGSATTLSVQSGMLNGAGSWQWYSGSCGGQAVGSGSSIQVNPSGTTTYFVRGEGGCATPGTCASIQVSTTPPPMWYLDADLDGYYSLTSSSCTNPGAGYSTSASLPGDCDDGNALINPSTTWHLDQDGDGYAASILVSCNSPGPFYTIAPLPVSDCNDSSASIHPGASEVCGNATDENCDGLAGGAYQVSTPVPSSGTTCVGVAGPTYTAVVTGSGQFSYQWYSNTVNANTGGTSAGAANGGQTPSYQTPASLSPGTTYYYCVVSQVGSSCPGIASPTVSRTVIACNAPSNDPQNGAILLATSSLGSCSALAGSLTNATVSPESITPLPPAAGQDVWYRFIASSVGVRIQVSAPAFNALIELLDAQGNLIATENALAGNGTEILNHYNAQAPLVSGQTYHVAVRNAGPGNAGNGSFTICAQRIRASGCNTSGSLGAGPFSTCNLLPALTVGAQSYQFHFASTTAVPQLGSPHSVTITPSNAFPAVQLSQLLPTYSYNVTVTATYQLTDGAGNPETFTVAPTSPCTILMGQHSDVFLRNIDQCPAARTSLSTVGANLWVCGAFRYEWNFSQPNASAGPVYGPPGSRFLNLSVAANAGLVPGNWDVTIRPWFLSGVVPSTDALNIRCLSLSPSGGATDGPVEPAQELRSARQQENTARIFPNPLRGDVIRIDVPATFTGEVKTVLRDPAGRMVAERSFTDNPEGTLELHLPATLPPGWYSLEIHADDAFQVHRVIMESDR